MPKLVRSVRHHDIVGTLGSRGFEPYRGPRRAAHRDCGPSCSCRTPPKRVPANDTIIKLTAKLQDIASKATKTNVSVQRMSDSLDRLGAAVDRTRNVADALRISSGIRR